jgi:hypothetical protein
MLWAAMGIVRLGIFINRQRLNLKRIVQRPSAEARRQAARIAVHIRNRHPDKAAPPIAVVPLHARTNLAQPRRKTLRRKPRAVEVDVEPNHLDEWTLRGTMLRRTLTFILMEEVVAIAAIGKINLRLVLR